MDTNRSAIGQERRSQIIGSIVMVAIVIAAVIAYGIAAGASTSHPTYALGKAAHCRVGYSKHTERHVIDVRVKVHGKWRTEAKVRRYVGCVWNVPKTLTAPTTTSTTTTTIAPTKAPTSTTVTVSNTSTNPDLAVHLDPSFVQSAANPLSVVYTASATASAPSGPTGIAQPISQLPAGVLDFYSDGSLACSTNVGGQATTTECPVTYTTLGAHTVVTEYVSGTNSATETDTEMIAGVTTKTSVVLDGDPGAGATDSTLTASVSSVLGTDSSPAAGSVTFTVDGSTLHTLSAAQTSCSLHWTGPSFVLADTAYEASATSSDCTVTGPAILNVSSFSYSARFAGVLGLSASSSTSTTVADWPQVPAPIYEVGAPYTVTFGPFVTSGHDSVVHSWLNVGISVSVSIGGSEMDVPGTVAFYNNDTASAVCTQFGTNSGSPCYGYGNDTGSITATFRPERTPIETTQWIGPQIYIDSHALIGASVTRTVVG